MAPEIVEQSAKAPTRRIPEASNIKGRAWEHSLQTGGVTGSIPVSPTSFPLKISDVGTEHSPFPRERNMKFPWGGALQSGENPGSLFAYLRSQWLRGLAHILSQSGQHAGLDFQGAWRRDKKEPARTPNPGRLRML